MQLRRNFMLVHSVGLEVMCVAGFRRRAPPGRDLAHGEDVDEPSKLLDDLIDVVRVQGHGHAIHARLLRAVEHKLIDHDAAAPEHADRAIQYSRTISNHCDKCVIHAVIISPMLFPCGTIGNTFASCSTRKPGQWTAKPRPPISHGISRNV